MDVGTSKLVLLLAARGGVTRDELEALLRDETKALRARLPEGGRVAAFLRLEDDPFARAPTWIRAFEGTLELRCDAGHIAKMDSAADSRHESFVTTDGDCEKFADQLDRPKKTPLHPHPVPHGTPDSGTNI